MGLPLDMERRNALDQTKMYGKQVVTVTGIATYEFLRAIATILVGGLFLFYATMTGILFYSAIQTGAYTEAPMIGILFLIASGSAVYFTAAINGVFEV